MQRLVQSFVRYNFFVIATPTATTTFPKNLIAIVTLLSSKISLLHYLLIFLTHFQDSKGKKPCEMKISKSPSKEGKTTNPTKTIISMTEFFTEKIQ